MKQLLTLFISIALLGHAQAVDPNNNKKAAKAKKSAAGAVQTEYDPSVPKPTVSELSYGPHARNMLDFWKADSDKPTPWVLFIHGGGWSAGSKEKVNGAVDVSQLLKAGISVVAINYRYVSIALQSSRPP